jgi:hypothetical protein
MNTRYKPARAPQIPSTVTLRTNSAHRYQNKGFANQNSQFLTPLFSHTCALSRLQPLCFDMLHKNTQGEGVTPSPTVPSRIGTRNMARHEEAEGSLSRPCGIGMTEGEERRNGSAQPLPDAARTWNFAPSPRTVGIHRLSRREGFHATFCQVSYV